MKTQKSRPFLVARKRGVRADVVRAILRALGAPPTLSEVGEAHAIGHFFDGSGQADNVYTYRKAGDEREISREMADEAVRIIMESYA